MNIGIVTGSISGIVVVDLDGEQGVQTAKAQNLTIPLTLLEKSPHGHHLFYRTGDRIINCATGLYPSIDIKGEGGCITVTPSSLPDGAYKWLNSDPMIDAPAWVMGKGHAARDWQGTSTDTWVSPALLLGMGDGTRNDTATRLAGYFHKKHLPDDVIYAILQPYAARCTPPFSEMELQTVIRSVSRYTPPSTEPGIDMDAGIKQYGHA